MMIGFVQMVLLIRSQSNIVAVAIGRTLEKSALAMSSSVVKQRLWSDNQQFMTCLDGNCQGIKIPGNSYHQALL